MKYWKLSAGVCMGLVIIGMILALSAKKSAASSAGSFMCTNTSWPEEFLNKNCDPDKPFSIGNEKACCVSKSR